MKHRSTNLLSVLLLGAALSGLSGCWEATTGAVEIIITNETTPKDQIVADGKIFMGELHVDACTTDQKLAIEIHNAVVKDLCRQIGPQLGLEKGQKCLTLGEPPTPVSYGGNGTGCFETCSLTLNILPSEGDPKQPPQRVFECELPIIDPPPQE